MQYLEDFLLITDIQVNNDQGDLDILFDDCRTIDGFKLPEFSEPPLLLPFTCDNSQVSLRIQEITTEKFNLNFQGDQRSNKMYLFFQDLNII